MGLVIMYEVGVILIFILSMLIPNIVYVVLVKRKQKRKLDAKNKA